MFKLNWYVFFFFNVVNIYYYWNYLSDGGFNVVCVVGAFYLYFLYFYREIEIFYESIKYLNVNGN